MALETVGIPATPQALTAFPQQAPPPPPAAAQRLVALFVAALLLLNFPLLALWDHPLRLAGLPLFPAALFGLWALLIVLLAWVLERTSD